MAAEKEPVGDGPERYFARTGVDPLSGAFERKTVVHAGMGGKPLQGEAALGLYEELMDRERSGKCAAYVHVPFCETHCLYCGFYSSPYRKDHSAPYVDALLGELEAERGRAALRGGPVHALYLGGGTPTALEPEDLRRLVQGLREGLPLANDCEITVEGRVHGFSAEKMDACLEAGANRFSLGVQTFDTDIRRSLGRVAGREEVLETLRRLRDHDNAAVVIDLIYGLPGQNMDAWQRDLETFLSLELDGCDLYQLNVFPGGRLDKAIQSGAAKPAADVAGQAELFRRGVETMNRHRLRRLSISHWGRTSRERNIYNPLMKRRSDCLAYGAGAGGSLGGAFYFVQSGYEPYMEARAQGRKPVVMAMLPPRGAAMSRCLTGQLEAGALDLARVAAETGEDAAVFEPLLGQWAEAGLLTREGSLVELTLAGQFWQVTMTQALIDWHQHQSMEHSA
jgi:oxygen-independent coproporphyrinogen-3 oxidase